MFYYLIPGILIYIIGIVGIILTRKNIIIMLMSMELMLIGINLNFVIFSIYLDDIMGQIISLYILTIAAAESAIGLALLIIYYRLRGVIEINLVNMLKG